MADRHQFRAKWHDYNGGMYFVTICCAEKRHLFGEINRSEMHLNECGKIAKDMIDEISLHFPSSQVLNYVIMPNHIHLLIAIDRNSTSATPNHEYGCLKQKCHIDSVNQDFHHNSALAQIIGRFKSFTTKKCRKVNPSFTWQSRFYDNIISDQKTYLLVMNYIDSNIERWANDCFYSDKRIPQLYY